MPLQEILLWSLLIFCCRILDVTIGTIRIVFISKGYKKIAPALGFAEVFIWISVLGNIMGNVNNYISYFFYAGGFAVGTYIGILIEEKLAVGYVLVRIFTKHEACDLVDALRQANYGVTVVGAEGKDGDVSILYCAVKRKKAPGLVRIVEQMYPKSFYTVEDLRYVKGGIFPLEDNLRQEIRLLGKIVKRK